MSDWKISTMSCSAGGAWDVWWRGRGGPWRSQPAGAAAGRAAHAQMIGYALYSKSCTAPSAQKPPAAPLPPAVAAGQRPRSRRAARCPAEWRRSAPSPALVAPRRGGHPGRQGWVGAPWRLYWDSVSQWQGAHVQPPSRQILEKVKFLHAFWQTAVKSGTNIETKLARTTAHGLQNQRKSPTTASFPRPPRQAVDSSCTPLTPQPVAGAAHKHDA